MALHLIKLCVGVDSVQELEEWIVEKRKKTKGNAREHIHTTRMVPKRSADLLDGGSLFWVIRGELICRQALLDVRPFVDREGVGRCRLVLEPRVVLVQPRPYRAFQGWRYLEAKEAPHDLGRAAPGVAKLPEGLRRELRELGLL
jgi:hypothetical protein